jgi:hypothetical protein
MNGYHDVHISRAIKRAHNESHTKHEVEIPKTTLPYIKGIINHIPKKLKRLNTMVAFTPPKLLKV